MADFLYFCEDCKPIGGKTMNLKITRNDYNDCYGSSLHWEEQYY